VGRNLVSCRAPRWLAFGAVRRRQPYLSATLTTRQEKTAIGRHVIWGIQLIGVGWAAAAGLAWPRQLIGLYPSAGFVVTTRPGALDVTGRSGITGMVQLQEVASGLLWGL
jgi:hypothetical protein